MAADSRGDALEDEYDSETDEDFNPEAAEARQANEVSSEDEDGTDATKNITRRNRSTKEPDENALDFDNSGDEATITKSPSKRRKLDTAALNEDEGGEGGLVKTRAQRRLEQHEKKNTVSPATSSIDVDTLWSQMSAAPHQEQTKAPSSQPKDDDHSTSPVLDSTENAKIDFNTANKILIHTPSDEPMMKIKRKIEFAGQTIEEEREVPASSAEAKLHIQQQNNQSPLPHKPAIRRPTKRKSPLDQPSTSASSAGGKKLNTIEKSKLDWAAQVDKDGIADELREHSRGKSDYLGRMDFLDRVTSKRE